MAPSRPQRAVWPGFASADTHRSRSVDDEPWSAPDSRVDDSQNRSELLSEHRSSAGFGNMIAGNIRLRAGMEVVCAGRLDVLDLRWSREVLRVVLGRSRP